ncbi:MAG: alpha/beta fold hydrolase [Deltaproteobacteria bacterium]|nr:alpha/beta fold hydrolase [Deltaproteobacteria bacterium]
MSPKPFDHPEHQPFYWQQGSDAALLIHGFPGTPAEMRPLGLLLQTADWTVHAPLLPGFGPEVETLPQKTFTDWIEMVEDCHSRLARDHGRILIVGNSMGGALALTIAAKCKPDGLILLAPFTHFASLWHRCLWPIISPFLRDIKPFQKADLSSPEIRRMIGRMFNDTAPDGIEIQRTIRNLSLPIRALDQLRRAGRAAQAAIPRVQAPSLVLQGSNDRIVTPAATRALVSRLGSRAYYFEMDSGHDLVEPDCPAWPEVTRCVLDFAGGIKEARS